MIIWQEVETKESHYLTDLIVNLIVRVLLLALFEERREK